MDAMLADALTELSVCVLFPRAFPRSTFMDLCYINSSIDRIHSQVVKRDRQRSYRRFFSSSVDKDKINSWTTNLDRSLKHFAVLVFISFSIVPKHSQDPTGHGDGGKPSES